MTSPMRVAVVTGANKSLGYEISRQLASNGVKVLLTARDVSSGKDAVKTLHDKGLTNVLFHQLDVTDKSSITILADFIKTQFGKLDLLVNNAGVFGSTILDREGMTYGDELFLGPTAKLFKPVIRQTYEDADHCLKTNYYGVKQLTRELLPLLKLSSSPRIVNISSSLGLLKYVTNEEAKSVLCNIDHLTEQKVDNIVEEFLHDLKEGKEEEKEWPTNFSAYIVSKAAVNAYTRIMAKEHKDITVNCVCPGFIKTDFNDHTGVCSVEEGAKGAVMLALMSEKEPSGMFFSQTEQSTF